MWRSMRINSQNIKKNRQKSPFALPHSQIFRRSIKKWLEMDEKHLLQAKIWNLNEKYVHGAEWEPIFDDFPLYFED